MSDLPWKEAIVQVLAQGGEPMHYAEIAEAITAASLRKKVGATPAITVASVISVSLQDEGENSPFLRVSRGIYGLRQAEGAPSVAAPPLLEEDETGFVNAFGMYWRRSNVHWNKTPKVLGRQQEGSNIVDFCTQKGVYLLHDGNRVVYVGRATDQPLGLRLRQHTFDRLNGRWDRFSWFGILSVNQDGSLSDAPSDKFNPENLIATMEALLIEGLEPPQNRKRGDAFSAVEFLQVEDPELEKRRRKQVLDELAKRLV